MYGYRACPDCGAAVQRSVLAADTHECAPERYASHQAMLAKRALEHLEEDLTKWLATPQGQFQQYLAQRHP